MRFGLWPSLVLAVGVLCSSAVAAQELDSARWDERFLVFAFGMEGRWGTLHPHGYDLKDTLEVYDFDPYPGLFNLNLVGEVLFAIAPNVEVGVHGAYDGLLDMDGPSGSASLTTQEIGGVGRLLLGTRSRDGYGELGLRLEGGLMFADFEVNGISDNYSTGFVRPALSFGGGGRDVGTELCIGWTFAQVNGVLAQGSALPLGGLDVTLLIRVAP